jgi:hypothetical protein
MRGFCNVMAVANARLYPDLLADPIAVLLRRPCSAHTTINTSATRMLLLTMKLRGGEPL